MFNMFNKFNTFTTFAECAKCVTFAPPSGVTWDEPRMLPHSLPLSPLMRTEPLSCRSGHGGAGTMA